MFLDEDDGSLGFTAAVIGAEAKLRETIAQGEIPGQSASYVTPGFKYDNGAMFYPSPIANILPGSFTDLPPNKPSPVLVLALVAAAVWVATS